MNGVPRALPGGWFRMIVAFRLFVVLGCLFRVGTLVISVRNERRLKSEGAREYGRGNSLVLGVLHGLIYLAALVEGFAYRGTPLDAITALGVGLFLVGAAALLVVIRTLGRLWTLKLLIASDHVLITHPLFRVMKHPNYFLGILPELLGFTLMLHAFWTMAIGLPVYLVSLGLRIRLEETVMKREFAAY